MIVLLPEEISVLADKAVVKSNAAPYCYFR